MNTDLGGARVCDPQLFRIGRWGKRPREPFPALARQEPRPTGCGSQSRAPVTPPPSPPFHTTC